MNQAIKEEMTSRRANQIAVPSIASAGRKVRNSEKKKTIIVPTIQIFRIKRMREVIICFLSSGKFAFLCIKRVENQERKRNEKIIPMK